MNPILEEVRKVGLMPVIKLTDPSKAVDLAKALTRGGIPVAEVTFRAAGAEKAIASIAKELPDMLVGAGTVINIPQAELAINSGAKYIVSPGFVPEVVKYCIDKGVPVIPGCTNASEVSEAANLGLEVVKFFPAEAMGGLKVLKALSGPFSAMKFIPTGGIGHDNLLEYLSFKKIIACGGSWMVPAKLVDNNDWDGITALAREAVTAMLDLKLKHIGINSKDESECNNTTETFKKVLNIGSVGGEVSNFIGSAIEVMKFMGRGKMGHIALGVSDVSRAIRYYESQGLEFDYDTLQFGDDGYARFIYFKEDIGGFGVHLVKN